MWTTGITKEKGEKEEEARIIGHFAHGVNKYNPHHMIYKKKNLIVH